MSACFFQQLFVTPGGARLKRGYVHKQLFLKIEQKQTNPGPIDRVARHQLGVRKTLVNVFVDDVRLVQNQVALNQNRHLAVGMQHVDVFGLVVQIDVPNFKVHAFFKQDETATVGKRAGST